MQPVPPDRLEFALGFALRDLIRYPPQDGRDIEKRDRTRRAAVQKVMEHLARTGIAFCRMPPNSAGAYDLPEWLRPKP